MESLLKHIRYSARMLAKNPGVAAISVLALALGIGLTTTMFSIVYGALHRGLPFEEPHRIMHLERNNLAEDIESMEVTVHDYFDWREQQTSFGDIAAFYVGTANLSGSEDRAERYSGGFMTANSFEVLRARPLLGRTFTLGDDHPDAARVVIIGYDPWQNRFGGDPDIIGRTVRLNSEVTTIVGVMPQGFAFPLLNSLWLPMRQDPLEIERGDGVTLEVFGRLNSGVSMEQALVELNTIAKRLAMEYPETNEGVGAVIKPYTKEYVGDEPSALLYTMLVAVFFVLLIACANVANLLLARAAVRSKEVAIRSALGASRWRVVLQFMSETLVLSVVGAVIGIGIAYGGVSAFNAAIVDADPPFWIDIRIDPIALVFVLGLTLVATLLSGIIPAIKASGANVNEILKDESRGTSSLRLGAISKGLVIGEIALSCGLLVAAGLTIKSIVQLRNIDYGFDTQGVFVARVGLFEAAYPDTVTRIQFFEELVERLEALPGARAAALTTNLPGTGSGRRRFAVEGEVYASDQDYPLTRRVLATSGFFETFGVSILQGRDFAPQDRADNLQVAIVNEAFAERFFPGESPLGRRIRLGRSDSEQPWLSIVGLAPDMFMGGVDNENPEGIYVPLAQNDARFMSIAVAARGDPLALARVVRDQVMAIDPDLPLYWVDSLAGFIAQGTWFYRVFGTLFMIFGFVALFLAGIGLYGVMAFSVSRRTQEVGVRMALGAQRGDVLGLILRQGLLQLGIGLFFGLALAALLSRMLQLVLFQVEPRDPVIFLVIALALLAIGLLASYIPARRATRVDPVAALRYE